MHRNMATLMRRSLIPLFPCTMVVLLLEVMALALTCNRSNMPVLIYPSLTPVPTDNRFLVVQFLARR